MLICAALGATSVAPAWAGPTNEPTISVASAAIPEVPVPDMLDPQGEPQLSTPADSEPTTAPAEEPAVKPGSDLSELVAQLRDGEPGSHELDCLATGIYFEAKSEPLAGQLAVGQVIANRAQSGGRFPPSYCGVLFQRGQFSFVHGHSLPAVNHANKQWQTAVAMAKIVDQGLKDSVVGNALFFHARYVSPGWHMKRVTSIGNHIFYR